MARYRSSSRSSRYSQRFSYFPEYVSVGERRAQAAHAARTLERQGEKLQPVIVTGTGRKLCQSWWGNAWCENLERFGDYENRLPRGRSYLRNGAVIDLRIATGKVKARVQGSELYEVEVEIKRLRPEVWKSLGHDCAGNIASVVDLIAGRFGDLVMKRLLRTGDGLFPEKREISYTCSCPDYAQMCKHVAATLMGIAVRFDDDPTLFFTLRGVDPTDLVAAVSGSLTDVEPDAAGDDLLKIGDDDLGALFDIEIGGEKPARAAGKAAKSSAQEDRAGGAAGVNSQVSSIKPTTPEAKPTNGRIAQRLDSLVEALDEDDEMAVPRKVASKAKSSRAVRATSNEVIKKKRGDASEETARTKRSEADEAKRRESAEGQSGSDAKPQRRAATKVKPGASVSAMHSAGDNIIAGTDGKTNSSAVVKTKTNEIIKEKRSRGGKEVTSNPVQSRAVKVKSAKPAGAGKAKRAEAAKAQQSRAVKVKQPRAAKAKQSSAAKPKQPRTSKAATKPRRSAVTSPQQASRWRSMQLVTAAELQVLGITLAQIRSALLDGFLSPSPWRGQYFTTRKTLSWIESL